MHPKRISVVILGILLLATVGFAQQQQGDVELGLQGAYYRTVGTDAEIQFGMVQGKIGWYVISTLEVGVGPMLSITSTPDGTGGSSTSTQFGGSAFLTYSFLARGAKAVPYFGAQYYIQDLIQEDVPSDYTDSGSLGINAGLKYFLTKKAAVDFSGNYMFSLNEGAEGGILYFAVGLSFLF
jgi:hypothetical protein